MVFAHAGPRERTPTGVRTTFHIRLPLHDAALSA